MLGKYSTNQARAPGSELPGTEFHSCSSSFFPFLQSRRPCTLPTCSLTAQSQGSSPPTSCNCVLQPCNRLLNVLLLAPRHDTSLTPVLSDALNFLRRPQSGPRKNSINVHLFSLPRSHFPISHPQIMTFQSRKQEIRVLSNATFSPRQHSIIKLTEQKRASKSHCFKSIISPIKTNCIVMKSHIYDDTGRPGLYFLQNTDVHTCTKTCSGLPIRFLFCLSSPRLTAFEHRYPTER